MLKGVDVSKWQSVGAGDGYDFVICKATEGCGYTDKTCDKHYQRAKKNGQLRGVYHFARPDLGNSAVAEADWFLNETKGYQKDAILILDWEPSGQLGNVTWAKAWCDRVYEKTGVHPVIYMSASVVNGYDWSSVAKDCGLWIAGYPAKYNVANPPTPNVSDMPYKIGKWAFWIIWQYTSSAGTLDKDISNLNKDQWAKYAGYYKEPVKEEPKAEKKQEEPVIEQPKEEPKEEPTSSKTEQVEEPEVVETAKKTDLETYEEDINKLNEKGIQMPFTLPQKVYETLRWLIAIVLPATALLVKLLDSTWGWGLPIEPILTTLSGVETFLGSVFCISYLANKDK